MSRTKNSLKIINAGMIEKIVSSVLMFVTRSVFLRVLGTEYLGLNSLFSSILQVLNLAELGFGTAIIYNMYKPIAENDTEKVCALMNFYKKVYRIIGIIVAAVGIVIMPFLKNLISGDIPNGINIYVLYGIYLFGTVSTYWLFAYKTCLLYVNQKNDIAHYVTVILSIIKCILQICAIALAKDYYLYVVLIPIISIANNIICAIIVSKKYPQYKSKGELNKESIGDIKKRVFGLMIQKVCGVTRNSLDSVFLSAYLGLTTVAIYNNYYLVMSTVTSFLAILTGSIIPSVGNSIATETVAKNHNDMMKFNFIYMWISGWCTICLLCLYQPFMKVWMYEKNLLPFETVILLCIYFYLLKIGDVRSVYSSATGLWWEGRYRAIVETVLNIVLNAILGYFFGVNGIILATIISLLLINNIWSSTIIYKYYFKGFNVSAFFKSHILYALVTIVVAIVTFFICNFIVIDRYLDIVVKGLICIIVPNILYFTIYYRTNRFNEAKEFVMLMVKGMIKRNDN